MWHGTKLDRLVSSSKNCRISVHSALSAARSLECSVPQGSCLGPWLYLTYAGTLFDVIPPSIKVYGFATTTPQTSDSNLHLFLLKELPFKNLKVVHSLLTTG
ncbi:hypothetical protein DPMN_002304 [Dreissena polymorpha]|uniref:Reverse transcriptase n=1 Tax=Dreissena polymorpha TaxID=45954 RepID=A0A9D4MMW2_DREPO|nr:hypothetical protein DPMN_002304 [Dreissena polymorpha]